ncbi:rRNA-processing protein fcf2 [Cladobotryum mycophilum]|uniref:rRNA-processing protein fcf2 n=1 Tax=Cladobotryum mycophilum TaxID=491253 RepID=A0ABR0SA71_9HYPO
MPDFIDDRVQQLLIQAEKRLHEGSAALVPSKKTLCVVKVDGGDASVPSQTPFTKLVVRAPDSEMKTQEHSKDTTGLSWFNLPKTNLTPEFKRDWQLLRMRGVLDPKHQKKALRSAPPKYSQVGEIIEGPTDFYSARLTRRERKSTLLEHIMTEHDDPKLKSKYTDIQQQKTSGKKAFYRKLITERRKRRG